MPAIASVETALSLIKADSSKILGLTVGTHKVVPGQQIPRAEAKDPPQFTFETTTASSSMTYIIIGLDLDAPFSSFNFFSPILHLIQPGLKLQPADTGSSSVLSAGDTPCAADYIAPRPPPGSGPHRYIFLLYEQPESFDARKYAPGGEKRIGNLKKFRYDLGAFEAEAVLGPVVAANYFCSN